jgi:NADH-quinone oxidoreductase subunit J
MEALFFYLFAFLSIVGGVLMVSFKNPLSGAFSLVLSLVSLAALFAMLDAEFIFILQILVYAGAIMVLVIFTIMLLNLNKEELHEAPVSRIRVLLILVLCALGAFGLMQVFAMLPASTAGVLPGAIDPSFGSIKSVGREMFGNYLYPFEVISLVLLVAVVGVVLLAKKVV